MLHKMLEADGALTTVLLTFFGIPVSFLLSLLSLYQFKRAYVLISLLSQKRLKNSYWRAVRPCKSSSLTRACTGTGQCFLHTNTLTDTSTQPGVSMLQT